MIVLVGGGVALPDSSSDLWVDAELYKSITSYKGDDIDQLCYTQTIFDDLQVCSMENGGKLRFLHLLRPGTFLCYCSSGWD
jgi:hypothetical protein